MTVRHDLAKVETCTIPETIQEGSPEIFPPTNGLGDTDHYMEPAGTNSEQLSPANANPRSSKYDLSHNPEPKPNNDHR